MKKTIRQFITFLGVGLINTSTTLCVIFGLIFVFDVHPWMANFLGYALGVAISFGLNRRLTFKDKGSVRRSSLRFLCAAAIAYGLNASAILAAEKLGGFNLYLSQILGNVVYTLSFFVLCRWVVFRNRKTTLPDAAEENLRNREIPPRGTWPKTEDLYVVLKVLVVTGFLLGFLDTTGFNPLDDHQFARTILQGKPFGAYYSQELGRFYPLVAQEYVGISALFGHEASLFYRVGTLKVALLAWMLSLAITSTGLQGGRAFLLWLLGIVSFGVASTLFRLHAGDLNALILLLGYLLLTRHSPEVMSWKSGRWWIGFLLAVCATLYKESIAVLLLIFSGSELIRLRLQNRWQELLRHLPIFGYALLYLGLYALWAGHPGDANYALTHQNDRATVLIKFVENNPSIFFLVLPTLLMRVVRNGRIWNRYRDFDSMLLAAMGYACLFVLLKMYSSYYLLPCMAFALVGLAGTWTANGRPQGLAKAAPIVLVLILVENAPAVISDLVFQKQVVVSHGRFLNYVSRWAPMHCEDSDHPCELVLEGTRQKEFPEVFVSLDAFLDLVAPRRFRLREELYFSGTSWQRHFGLGHEGDFILIQPYQSGPRLSDSPSLRTVFDSGDAWAPPRWRLDQWVYFCGFASHFECQTALARYRRPVSYQLLEKIRDTLPPKAGEAIRNPRYVVETERLPGALQRNQRMDLSLRLRNEGSEPWLPDLESVNPQPVRLAYRWFDTEGRMILEGGRSMLPEAILPGETVLLNLALLSPQKPGLYRLEITPVQEGVLWFQTSFVREILVQ